MYITNAMFASYALNENHRIYIGTCQIDKSFIKIAIPVATKKHFQNEPISVAFISIHFSGEYPS